MAVPRPNFYLLLDLDPAIDDWPSIERRLQQKKEQWSKDRTQGNPKAKRRAEVVLPLLKDIEETLKDPVKRRQEARQAALQQEAARTQSLRELDEAIAVLRMAGECDGEQWKSLLQHYEGRFTQDNLRQRLRSAGIRLSFDEERPKETRSSAPSLDKTLVAQLQKNLEHLGHASLYEFLALRSQSSPQVLLDRARNLYAENLQRGRADADSSAMNELAGLCSKIFANDVEKAKYDRYLGLAAMEELTPQLQLAGADGILERQEIEVLVQQARQRGVERADAESYIADYAATRKWRLQKPTSEAQGPEPQLCGFCRSLSPPEATRCKGCGEPLRLECPRCGTANPSADAACGRCGARIGDAPLVRELLREGEELALGGDASGALSRFDQALLYWPDWPPLVQARKRVEELRKAREQALAEIEGFLTMRQLVAAQEALDRLERASGCQGLERLRERIRGGLTRAQEAFEKAEVLRREGRDSEGVLDLYEEALALCSDFRPARQALEGYPPPAPTGLKVEPSGSGFRLRWLGPPSKRPLRYRVLRKPRTAPQAAEDGERVAELAATELEDPVAAPGVAWWYAVFTVRSTVPSRQAASSGPHLLLGEVEDLAAVAGDGQISLRWSVPAGCLRVEVRRSRQEVPSATGGASVATSGSSVLDAGLTNGETYGYRVVAVYADPFRAGGELCSRGRHLLARPVAPPQPVEDLRAAVRDGVVELCWTPLSAAQVELRQIPARRALAPGSTLSLAELGRLGEPVSAGGNGFARSPIRTQGWLFFQPFSIREQTAVAGAAVEVMTLEPVGQLKARRTGAGLALTWTWPEGVSRALVAWDGGSYPLDPQSNSPQRRSLTRAEYDQSGCWLLPYHLAGGRLHFCVFSVAEDQGAFSAPERIVDSGGQIATVHYEVATRKHFLTRAVLEAWVELSTSDRLSVLPTLILVGKAVDVPISAKDGEVIAEPAELPLSSGQGRLAVPGRFLASRYFLKLFFFDPAAAREIRLLPAARKRLQIA